jgi:hypothetical protein
VSAELAAELEALGIAARASQHDVARARFAGRDDGQQPDRAWPQDDDRVVCVHSGEAHGFHRHGEGFEQHRGVGRDGAVDAMHDGASGQLDEVGPAT